MSHEPKPNAFELAPELAAIRQQLARLTPTPPRIDRDQLMWTAGHAAALAQSASQVAPGPGMVRRSSRVWPLVTTISTAAAVLLAAMFLQQDTQNDTPTVPLNTSQIASADSAEDEESRPATWSYRPTSGYLAVRNLALTGGLTALNSKLDATAPATTNERQPMTTRELRDELLPLRRKDSLNRT